MHREGLIIGHEQKTDGQSQPIPVAAVGFALVQPGDQEEQQGGKRQKPDAEKGGQVAFLIHVEESHQSRQPSAVENRSRTFTIRTGKRQPQGDTAQQAWQCGWGKGAAVGGNRRVWRGAWLFDPILAHLAGSLPPAGRAGPWRNIIRQEPPSLPSPPAGSRAGLARQPGRGSRAR